MRYLTPALFVLLLAASTAHAGEARGKRKALRPVKPPAAKAAPAARPTVRPAGLKHAGKRPTPQRAPAATGRPLGFKVGSGWVPNVNKARSLGGSRFIGLEQEGVHKVPGRGSSPFIGKESEGVVKTPRSLKLGSK
ncbi:MAG: hypothetical protein QNJ98_15920 [Planctomycetota bacterium]|nr:hypothetical protein [Planctomycetota bacterium]